MKEAYRPAKRCPRASCLDPFKGRIMGLLQQHPYSAVQVLDQYGFAIKACNVRKANEKGIVENAVGYVKHNFLAGRPITGLGALNAAARLWLEQTANVRLHATTRQRPLDRFVTEKPLLKPLPPYPYDIATLVPVRADRQFRIALDGNRYSVPFAYASRKLMLKRYPEKLLIFDGDTLIAEHVRSYDRGQDIADPEHAQPLLERKRRADDQHLVRRFLSLSPQAEAYYRQLVERKLSWKDHLRKIVALCDVYGNEKVAQALSDALVYQAFASDYIANILEQRQRHLPEPGPLHITHKQDLLELQLPEPDLAIYERHEHENPN